MSGYNRVLNGHGASTFRITETLTKERFVQEVLLREGRFGDPTDRIKQAIADWRLVKEMCDE
jgi:hypothetical protein